MVSPRNDGPRREAVYPVSSIRIVLLRHAESEWNALGRWQGQADPPLSSRGWARAHALAAELAGVPFAALYASDLSRARDTAAVLGRALGLEPRLEPRLRELHVGTWSGLSRAAIAARWPAEVARVLRMDPEVRPGGGETPGELAHRASAALEAMAARHPGGRVLAVTHGGLVGSLTGRRLRHLETLAVTPRGSGWAVVDDSGEEADAGGSPSYSL